MRLEPYPGPTVTLLEMFEAGTGLARDARLEEGMMRRALEAPLAERSRRDYERRLARAAG